MRRLSVSLFFTLLLVASPVLRADSLIAFWDLNGTLAPSIETTASLTTSISGNLFDRQSFNSVGSDLNLPDGFDPGQARHFSDLISVGAFQGRIEITGINLVGLSTPTLSFAIRKSHLLEFFDYFRVEIDTGDGWTFYQDLDEPSTDYSVRTATVTTPLPPDLTNFGMRIVFGATFEIIEHVDVDNVQVNAVPEPSAVALLAIAAAVLGFFAFRRRQAAR